MLIITILAISACGKTFDASSYVKAVLDTITKAEFDKYIELTNSTKEEAQKDGDNLLVDVTIEPIDIFEGLESEIAEAYATLLEDLLADYNATGEMPDEQEIWERYTELSYDITKEKRLYQFTLKELITP